MPKQFRDYHHPRELAHLQTLLLEGDFVGILKALPRERVQLNAWMDAAYAKGDGHYLNFPEVIQLEIARCRERIAWDCAILNRSVVFLEKQVFRMERLAYYLNKLQAGELTIDEAIQAEKLAEKLEAAA